jgi:uncharacterized repeat protein (TIGR03803 family)
VECETLERRTFLSAGPIHVLTSFDGSNGEFPAGNLTTSGNTLYGSAGGGPDSAGIIYSLPLTGGSPTILGSFNGTNGYGPNGDLILVGNTLYGTTEYGGDGFDGGPSGSGTVFSIPAAGGTPAVLASFSGSGAANPVGGIILSGNTIYGTTFDGGTSNQGTVFSVPITGGSPTILTSFSSGASGYDPFSPNSNLVLSGSSLYGVAAGGTSPQTSVLFAPRVNF